MNGTSDMGPTETYGDEGGLDPRGAARLLAQTRRAAERKLDFSSPRLSLFGAAVVLAAFGAVWLSVRGQHPTRARPRRLCGPFRRSSSSGSPRWCARSSRAGGS